MTCHIAWSIAVSADFEDRSPIEARPQRATVFCQPCNYPDLVEPWWHCSEHIVAPVGVRPVPPSL
jgi:hypothetical protein